MKFQSTPPARGATPPNRCGHPSTQFQSTPPARGATKTRLLKIAKQKISIHAPREGGDIDFDAIKKGTMDISIHAPREGGDAIRAARQEAQAISIHAPREGGDNTRPPIRQ